jgi:hypothetical protein
MKNVKFNATALRTILVVTVILLTAGLIGGFYYAQTLLNEMAVDVSKTSSELAKVDNDNAQSALQTKLDNLKPVEAKAIGIVYPSTDYQSMVSSDLSKYASSTGVQVEAVSPGQLPIGSTASNIAGIQTAYVKVTIKNPVPVDSLIKFIKAIETNLPKMKLKGITISNSADKDDSVAVDPLILEVYTK